MKDKQTTQQPAPKVHKEIRAQSFVVVDDMGQNRAELKLINDESVLSMHDARGLLRLTLRAGPREVTLNIFGDQKHKNRPAEAIDLLSLGWEMGDQTPFVKVYDRDEENEVTTVRDLAAAEDDEDEDVNEEEDEADDEGDGDNEAWDFSKAFTFDPAEQADIGDLVLVRHGQKFAIVQYDGQQPYLGTVTDTEVLEAPTEAELRQIEADVDAALEATNPAPLNRFNVPGQFNELAERLAAHLGDDELLGDFIRLAFAIADEPDRLNRESLALTVANQAFTRTVEFSQRLDGILRDAQPA